MSLGSFGFFGLATQQAFLAKAECKPNPAVGAVVEKDGRLLGVGRTQAYGSKHAEVEAIRKAGSTSSLSGATLYVTLTPCSHHGKTPPCAEAIVRSGIGRVFIGNRDLSLRANASQTESLFRASGIDYEYNFPKELNQQLLDLNADFFFRTRFGRPLVTLKMALTLDGKMATRSGDSRWVSCEASRGDVHRKRAVVDAILVGARTVNVDQPKLTCRLEGGASNPLRIVVCTNDVPLRVASGESVFSKEAETIFLAGKSAKALRSQIDREGFDCIPYDQTPYSRSVFVELMERRNLNALLVEGGSKTYSGFLEANLVDRVWVYHSMSKVLGDGEHALSPFWGSGERNSMQDATQLVPESVRRVGDDLLVEAHSQAYAQARTQIQNAVFK